MMSAREVATRYGVSTTFIVKALERIGCLRTEPDTPLSEATIARFERAYGQKIRAARPVTADSASAVAPVRQPPPHLMRVAHAKVTGKRDPQTGARYKALLDDPGIVHAIDAAGTWNGDPWRGNEAPGDVHFYDLGGPYAACGVRVRAVLGDRFDPEDADRAVCPSCADLVVEGKGFRTPPHERRSAFCNAYLRLKVGGRVTVEECRLRDVHDGPHRTLDGATWESGAEDYVPAPPG